ncbi:class I SAM-dependent methyltransferase [Mesorhizobium sp. M0166]|uniref:O-methyltransferase n=1 Tax=unclassified Mesorhizobium TaxID=325217 RepID=UPI003335BF2C
MKLAPYIQEAVLGIRARVNSAVDSRWNNAPFGTAPHATREQYLRWHQQAQQQEYYEIDRLERDLGYTIDRKWLDELALHTQIVKKKSDLAYPHGRLLYTLMRNMLSNSGLDFATVLETGTARGFSALCMSKAMADQGVAGRIVTLDVLPHLKRQIWNCIDDHDGPKSRAEILQPWADLARNILFLQGDTLDLLPKVGLDRINFAFLDAQHIESSVMQEFELVSARQKKGDMIVFDDVTSKLFPGVVKAVDRIENSGLYSVKRLVISDSRAYAWAQRV